MTPLLESRESEGGIPITRQPNKEIAEEAAYRDRDDRAAMEYGVCLAIGAAIMGDPHALKLLRVFGDVIRRVVRDADREKKKRQNPSLPSCAATPEEGEPND